MVVIGVDDTDSRERGMCTTFVAHWIAERLAAAGASVERVLLVRLNPAVAHKTRGNAALAVHTDAAAGDAFEAARAVIDDAAATADPDTNPGLVVAPHAPAAAPTDVAAFARAAVRDHHERAAAAALAEDAGYRHRGWKNGRGTVGALAAVGAWTAWQSDGGAVGPGEWTYEHVSYRERERRGTPRDVDRDSVFVAAEAGYPAVWDTVDRGEGEAVCVPHTPGPVLHGVRGDDPAAVRRVARAIESEPVAAARLFVTNQGTDAHLRDAALADVRDGRSYRVTGAVVDAPATRRGGHVFLAIGDDGDGGGERNGGDGRDASDGGEYGDGDRLRCAAFEPTKRFRDRVRGLRIGDRITVCGEVATGTLKLEKFAVRDRRTTERVTPTCPDCGRTMESAGADQGYRCRDCGTTRDGAATVRVERDLEPGWYEVPPCARRHVAKPLVRGGFDAPVHPER